MRAFPLRSLLACSLALALGSPASALAAAPAGKSSKSSKPAKGDEAASGGKGADAKGDASVPEAPAAGGPPRVGRIFIDADGLGPAGPVLAGRTMRAATKGLETQSVTITDAPAGPELRVVLKTRDAGGYRVEYEIIYDGKTVKDGTGGFDCQLCTEDELVEKVEALAVQVSPKLVVPEPEDLGPGPGDPEPDEKDPDDPDPTPAVVDGNPNALRTMGKAGVGLLVAGGLGTIAGITLVVLPPKNFDLGHPNATQFVSTRPPGYGVLAGGVAVAVVGAVLLGLDRKQAKKRRAAASASSPRAEAHVNPWFGPGGAGVGVVGRF